MGISSSVSSMTNSFLGSGSAPHAAWNATRFRHAYAGQTGDDADVLRYVFELTGDIRRHPAVGEKWLRVTGRDEVELAPVVELADRVQRLAAARRSESERSLELGALRLCRPAPGQSLCAC